MYDWSRFTKGGREREDAPEGIPSADPADLSPAAASGPGGLSRGAAPDPNVTVANRPPPPSPSPATVVPGVGSTDQVETVIGAESSIQGTIRSEHSIRIQGSAQGEIESKRAIYVEEGARVSAKITAAEITISGQVDGQIFSTGWVEIRPTGRVTGEVNAASLVMQEGAYLDGQIKMRNRGQPDDGSASERETPPGPTGRRLPGAASARNSLPAE